MLSWLNRVKSQSGIVAQLLFLSNLIMVQVLVALKYAIPDFSFGKRKALLRSI